MTMLSTQPAETQEKTLPTAKLCLMNMSIKAPSGSRGAPESFKTESKNDEGEFVVVNKKAATAAKWRISQHPLWKQLSQNKAAMINLRALYTVPDVSNGCYLIPKLKVAHFTMEMTKLEDERKELANEMMQKWESEVIPAMESAIGPGLFSLHVRGRLFKKHTIPERFAVSYDFMPLSPLSGDDIDFSDLTTHDAAKYSDMITEKAKAAVLDRFRLVADCILDETLTLCEEIGSGSLETGKKKGGSITQILDILERVQNFHEFASEEVLDRVKLAHYAMQGVSIKQMNNPKSRTRDDIKAVFAPLADAIRNTQQENESFEYARDIEY